MVRGPRSAADLEAAFAAGADDPPSPSSGPLRVGQDFGTRYTVLKLLGVGGMGVVYQVLDRDLGVPVALKVLRLPPGNPKALAEMQRRFKTELLLARKVTHKNVIRIHDIGDIDGIKFITMPFVNGQDLATILKKGRFRSRGPCAMPASSPPAWRRPTPPVWSTAISSPPTS